MGSTGAKNKGSRPCIDMLWYGSKSGKANGKPSITRCQGIKVSEC